MVVFYAVNICSHCRNNSTEICNVVLCIKRHTQLIYKTDYTTFIIAYVAFIKFVYIQTRTRIYILFRYYFYNASKTFIYRITWYFYNEMRVTLFLSIKKIRCLTFY